MTESLTHEDYRKLKARWVTPDLADAAGLFRVSSSDGATIVGRNGAGDYSGIAIPYFRPGTNEVREYRLRRDNPELEYGADGKPKEKNKYLSPPGRGNLIYFPPRIDPELLPRTDIPVAITEGELKTLALWRLAVHESTC